MTEAAEPLAPEPIALDAAPTVVEPVPTLIEPVLVPPRGLVTTTLLLLATTAGLAVTFAPPYGDALQPSLALDFWAADARELAEMRQRDQQLTARIATLPSEATLRHDWARWLALEAELGSEEVQGSSEARLLLGDLQERARTLVLQHGPDAWRAVAVRWSRDVQQSFGALAAQAQQRGVAVRDVLGTGAAAPLDKLAPGLGRTLADTGIDAQLQGAHALAAAEVVAGLAAMRMLDLAVRAPHPPRLPLDVQALLLRYRVEAHQGLAIERKLVLLDQLHTIEPTYPAEYVGGVLLARADDCVHAVPALARAVAAGQLPQLARVNRQWCIERISAR